MNTVIQDENYLTTDLLSNANTLVADGIHQVHFTGAGRSEGFGGNKRTEMNYKTHQWQNSDYWFITWRILSTSSRNLVGLNLQRIYISKNLAYLD